jgi:hypothetical protein
MNHFDISTLKLPSNRYVSLFNDKSLNLMSFTGGCGLNGEGCTLVEATLRDGASSADISVR